MLLRDIRELQSEDDLQQFTADFSQWYQEVVTTHPECLSWNNFERRHLAG